MRDYRLINATGDVSYLMTRREAYNAMCKVRANALNSGIVVKVIDRQANVIFTRELKGN
jgi:hypothetical protein